MYVCVQWLRGDCNSLTDLPAVATKRIKAEGEEETIDEIQFHKRITRSLSHLTVVTERKVK